MKLEFKRLLLISIAVLFPMYVSSTAGVEEELNKIIDEQSETIVNQNETLVQLIEKLLDLKNQLIEQNETLVEQTNKLEEQNNKLEEQNNKLEEQNNKLEEQNNKLEEQNNKLEEQNNRLEEQKNKLEEQIIEIANQSKKIDEFQNKLLFRTLPKSCKDIKDSHPSSVSGIYEIEIDGEKLEVRCEMNSAAGGWTVFHNRYNGSVNFNRRWTSFKQGFGDLNGEFWFGLKNLNKLTKNSVNDLRVEMSSFDGRKKYAEYKEFKVGNATENYKLSFKEGSYSGDAGDSLNYHNGKEFSTSDTDNDEYFRGNCAALWGGANWWGYCGHNNINGKYGGNGDIGIEFMWWHHFDNFGYNSSMALKTMTLMFRPAF